MKFSRFLALVLALMMVMGLVPAAMADEEPVKISVAGYMFGPIDNERDVITPLVEQQLKEKHGINVDIEVVYIEQANYAEILNTRLTGDKAPDVFLAQSATALNSYYDQGVIKEWDEDFFKENAPDVYNFIMNGTLQNEHEQYRRVLKSMAAFSEVIAWELSRTSAHIKGISTGTEHESRSTLRFSARLLVLIRTRSMSIMWRCVVCPTGHTTTSSPFTNRF